MYKITQRRQQQVGLQINVDPAQQFAYQKAIYGPPGVSSPGAMISPVNWTAYNSNATSITTSNGSFT